ncbi:hypothetical protein U1Q18_050404 [Sarracenia purpurea var. burkii]
MVFVEEEKLLYPDTMKKPLVRYRVNTQLNIWGEVLKNLDDPILYKNLMIRVRAEGYGNPWAFPPLVPEPLNHLFAMATNPLHPSPIHEGNMGGPLGRDTSSAASVAGPRTY